MSTTATMQQSAADTASQPRFIKTGLIGKNEVFRFLALAEATQLPVLLIGEPGVSKTKTVMEYSKSLVQSKYDGRDPAQRAAAHAEFMNSVFILETDEGTNSTEIKGHVDMKKYAESNIFEIDAPVTRAQVVVINEVDKASSQIRNSMLGIMNERVLFNGQQKVPCKWKLFIATCNEIPKEEVDSPFWDRFALKMVVNRVSNSELNEYFQKGDKNYSDSFQITIPNKTEMDSVVIPERYMSVFLDICYSKCSDRTLTFVPKITRAVKHVWNCSVEQALIKTAAILVDPTTASQLEDKLITPDMRELLKLVEKLHTAKDTKAMQNMLTDISEKVRLKASMAKITQDETNNLAAQIQDVMTIVQNRFEKEAAAKLGKVANVI